MDNINLNSFLKFGYFLDYNNPNIKFDFSEIDKNKYVGVSEACLIDTANDLWFNTINRQFNQNEKHVVPLSGGLDSRAILATLLEFTSSDNIQTYTFGSPGSYDYEIGKMVAKQAGTKHYTFDLTKSKYKQDELIEVSKRVDHQTLLFLHPPLFQVDSLFSDYNVWSGSIIDVFFGRHKHNNVAGNLNGGIKNFFLENTFVRSTNLNNIGEEEYSRFIDFDTSVEKSLAYEHILDIFNRQLKFIAPHVLLKGFNYKTLLNTELIDFANSLENKYLDNQYLYKEMFLKRHPVLFSLPTKSNYGLPLGVNSIKKILKRSLNYSGKLFGDFIPSLKNRNLNYINFETAIRDRQDMRDIIYNNLMDLKNRDILYWVNIDKLWQNHINSKNNHADALMVLASLEIHLKAGKKI